MDRPPQYVNGTVIDFKNIRDTVPWNYIIMENNSSNGHLRLILANMIFGMNFSLFVSVIHNYMSFQNLFFIRILFSAIVFIPFIFFAERRIHKTDILRIIGVSLLIVYGKQYLMLWGAGYTSPVDSSVLATMGPIFTLIVSAILVHEKIHIIKILGICLGIAGALSLIFHNGLPEVSGGRAFGDILIFVSTFAAATNTVLIKPTLMKYGVATVMGWYYIIGLLTTAPFFAQDFFAQDFSAIPWQGYIEIAIICLLGTILPNYLLYSGTAQLTSVHTALYFYLQPATATLFALLRHQETFDKTNLIAAALIFTGVIFIIISYQKYKFPAIPVSDDSIPSQQR